MNVKTNHRARTLVVRSVGLMLGAAVALMWQPLVGQHPGGRNEGCAGGSQCYATPNLEQPDVCESNWDLSTGCNMGIDICSGCVVDNDPEDLNFY